jgi:hypothetical protein
LHFEEVYLKTRKQWRFPGGRYGRKIDDLITHHTVLRISLFETELILVRLCGIKNCILMDFVGYKTQMKIEGISNVPD